MKADDLPYVPPFGNEEPEDAPPKSSMAPTGTCTSNTRTFYVVEGKKIFLTNSVSVNICGDDTS